MMAHDYAEQKIKEAIEQSNGSASLACKLLVEWAIDDQMLLLALTQNHLKSIVAHAVNRVSPQGGAYIEKAKKSQAKPTAKPVSIDLPPESFGRDLLQALSGRDAVRFGMEGVVGKPIVRRKKKASQQHIDALKKMSVIPSRDSKESR